MQDTLTALTPESFQKQIAAIPHRGAEGYFGPQSMSWRLYREPIVLFGGMRALLLQVAHPAVAEGVARYSRFREDALGRGFRTFEAMASIYFGSDVQARQTAFRLYRMHQGIKAHYPAEVPQKEGEAFRAIQPELLLWVLATLTDTTLLVFEHFSTKHLPADWRERFYEESKTAASLLGIPPEAYPPDLPAFREYIAKMLQENGILGTATVAQDITAAILQHRLNITWLAKLLAIGWMPPFLWGRLGIAAEAKHLRRFERVLRITKGFYRLVPAALKLNPAWFQAHYRIRKAKGEKPRLVERLFGWLGEKAYLPFGLR